MDDLNSILTAFVRDNEMMYGPDINLSGMHELLHIVQCKLDFGPLNVVNTFPFEENNLHKIVQNEKFSK